MMWLDHLLSVSSFSPHGFCLAWQPSLLGWTIVGNGATALAYFLIPLRLFSIVWTQRLGQSVRLGRDPRIVALFGAFILLCGFGHVIDVLVLWWPAYWLQAACNVATGFVSLLTLVMMEAAFVSDKEST